MVGDRWQVGQNILYKGLRAYYLPYPPLVPPSPICFRHLLPTSDLPPTSKNQLQQPLVSTQEPSVQAVRHVVEQFHEV